MRGIGIPMPFPPSTVRLMGIEFTHQKQKTGGRWKRHHAHQHTTHVVRRQHQRPTRPRQGSSKREMSLHMTAYVACVWVCLVVVVVLQQQVAGFTLTNAVTRRRCSTLFMGRAAAVRAATKAKTDGAKAKNNARFAKKIIMAVKAGGADPDKNRALGQVIADAKVANVPKDVVTRNIEKASAAATADFKSSVFEFYGHGGCGLIVNVLTDNDNRAAADVNLVAKKQLLKNAAMNSVLFKFDTKARLNLQKAIEEDQLMEVCLEAGVDDYELRTEVDGNPLGPPEEGQASIYVDVKDMAALRDALRAAGYDLETSLASVPKEGVVDLGDEDFDKNMEAIDAFLALDDVDSVEHNINMTGDD